jgi:hypothetical protein
MNTISLGAFSIASSSGSYKYTCFELIFIKNTELILKSVNQIPLYLQKPEFSQSLSNHCCLFLSLSPFLTPEVEIVVTLSWYFSNLEAECVVFLHHIGMRFSRYAL